MNDPYESPSAELREELEPRGYVHAIIGAISSFVVILAFFFGNEDLAPDQHQYVETLVIITLFSLVSGAALLIFRRLPWHWAAIGAPLIEIALLVIAAYTVHYFGLPL